VTAEQMSDADVLEAAADALYIHGRCVAGLGSPGGRLCLVGAVHYARTGCDDHEKSWCGVVAYEDPVLATVASHIGLSTAINVGGRVAIWHDSKPLTPEGDAEVIDTLRRCAKHLRNEGLS
jgi:hypothetical protein